MGHLRLLVQGHRVDLSHASRIAGWTVASAGRSWADHSPSVSYSSAVSVTVLILDRLCQDSITERELATPANFILDGRLKK